MSDKGGDEKINSLTIQFVNKVESLISKGIEPSEIIKKLDWNKSTFSLVRNKKRNVPIEKFDLLHEVYKFENNMDIGISDLMPIIKQLINQNDLLANSTAEAIATNKSLAYTNKRFADKILGGSTATVPEQTLAVGSPMFDRLVGLLADVASGTHYENRKQALIAIHKVLYADLMEDGSKNIHENSGK